jgi:hypothetical protein
LFCCLAHIELGHLDERRQQQWLKSRIRNGRRKGLKTLRAELDREASQWALQQLSRASLTPSIAAPEPLRLDRIRAVS